MTLDTAFALASDVSNRTGPIRWHMGVAGALAAAAAIDLLFGFSLTVPAETMAEVDAVVHEIDEREARKKAASLEEQASQL